MKITQVQPQSQGLQLIQQEGPHTSKTLKSRNTVHISFTNLSYSVIQKQGQKVILDNLTGFCPGGQVTALMGSSGAGKTTLLNILSCRAFTTSNTSLTGSFKANGQQYNADVFQGFASYVMQNDILMEAMTPKETFQFVAQFKYIDTDIIKSRVEETIKALKLTRCENTYIGGHFMKGISGGERKRVSIGAELVANPSVILIDEPTSGLDSFTSFQIINLLKELAQTQDRTIIFTIHQPNADIFHLFDRIMLLAQGKFVYQGSQNQIIEYFNNIGYNCPIHSNPMDYVISLIHQENRNEYSETIKNLSQAYNDQQYQNVINEIEDQLSDTNQLALPLKYTKKSAYDQIKIIANRDFLNVYRDPMQLKARMISGIFLGLLQGGVFWQIGDNSGTMNDAFSITGALFFLIIIIGIQGAFYNLLAFVNEREIFLREDNSKLYKVYNYFIGKQIIEIPLSIIQPVCIGLISYFMSGYNTIQAEYIFIHLLILILFYASISSVGQLVGCVFPDIREATNLGPSVVMPIILFSGFFANSKYFYKWAQWLQYVTPLKYAFEALCLNEVEQKYYEIDIAETYGFNFTTWECIGYIAIFIIGFRIIALLFLYLIRIKLQ